MKLISLHFNPKPLIFSSSDIEGEILRFSDEKSLHLESADPLQRHIRHCCNLHKVRGR
jgi:hypothetical protein